MEYTSKDIKQILQEIEDTSQDININNIILNKHH